MNPLDLLSEALFLLLPVETPGKDYSAFINIVKLKLAIWLKKIKRKPEWVREKLIAGMDGFVLEKDANMQMLKAKFGAYEGRVHSLLVTFGRVEMQMIHIDMLFPNYQGVLLLTEGPGTHVFPAHQKRGLAEEDGVSVEQYADWLWSELWGYAGKEAFVSAINRCPDLAELVKEYGVLGVPLADLKDSEVKVSPGEQRSLKGYFGFPGSWPHCGPACEGFRAVMFSSYCPKSESEKAYDPNIQYSPFTLLSEVLTGLEQVRDILEVGDLKEALPALTLMKATLDKQAHERMGQLQFLDLEEKEWTSSEKLLHAAHTVSTTFKKEGTKCFASDADFAKNMKEKLPGNLKKEKFEKYLLEGQDIPQESKKKRKRVAKN
jgi:hypothetical protein